MPSVYLKIAFPTFRILSGILKIPFSVKDYILPFIKAWISQKFRKTRYRHDIPILIAENCCDRLYRHHSTCVGLKNQVWTAVKINVLSTLAKNLNGKKK